MDDLESIVIRAGKVSKATHRSAGWDVFCSVERVLIRPSEIGIVPIGLQTTFPAGCVGLLKDKSGYARNHGLHILGGVIDGDYPDTWEAIILNTGREPFVFTLGKKVTQVLFMELSSRAVTATGDGIVEYLDNWRMGGFGSTGV